MITAIAAALLVPRIYADAVQEVVEGEFIILIRKREEAERMRDTKCFRNRINN